MSIRSSTLISYAMLAPSRTRARTAIIEPPLESVNRFVRSSSRSSESGSGAKIESWCRTRRRPYGRRFLRRSAASGNRARVKHLRLSGAKNSARGTAPAIVTKKRLVCLGRGGGHRRALACRVGPARTPERLLERSLALKVSKLRFQVQTEDAGSGCPTSVSRGYG